MAKKKQDWSPRLIDAARTIGPFLADSIKKIIAEQRKTGFAGPSKEFQTWVDIEPLDRGTLMTIAWNSGILQYLLILVEYYEVQLPFGLRDEANFYIYEWA